MESLVLITALLVSLSTLTAHSTQRCSQISIESASKVDPGTPVVFRALVKDVPTQLIAYKWKVSAGTITSGEETATVTVDTTGLGGQSITATVEVLTRENTCSGSKRVDITPPPPVDGHFDQYGDIKFVDEKARLDNFAIQLMNFPTARGVILTVAGNPTYKGEASYRLGRAKNYLVNVRGVPSSKVMTIDGGYRDDLTTVLIIVPSGANFSPSGLISGEPPNEIRFTKKPPRSFSRSSKRQRPVTKTIHRLHRLHRRNLDLRTLYFVLCPWSVVRSQLCQERIRCCCHQSISGCGFCNLTRENRRRTTDHGQRTSTKYKVQNSKV